MRFHVEISEDNFWAGDVDIRESGLDLLLVVRPDSSVSSGPRIAVDVGDKN